MPPPPILLHPHPSHPSHPSIIPRAQHAFLPPFPLSTYQHTPEHGTTQHSHLLSTERPPERVEIAPGRRVAPVQHGEAHLAPPPAAKLGLAQHLEPAPCHLRARVRKRPAPERAETSRECPPRAAMRSTSRILSLVSSRCTGSANLSSPAPPSPPPPPPPASAAARPGRNWLLSPDLGLVDGRDADDADDG